MTADRGFGRRSHNRSSNAPLLQSPWPPSKLDVPVFTTARGMLNREDHDLLCPVVDHVIDEIAVFGRHEFADALDYFEDDRSPENCQICRERSIASLTTSAADGLRVRR
jgi:hypothetical protein